MTTPPRGEVDTPILTLEEAAALIKAPTLRWLQRSDCPRVRKGGIVRYDRDAVLEWFRDAA